MKVILAAFLIFTGAFGICAGKTASALDEKLDGIQFDSATGALKVTKTLAGMSLSSDFHFSIQLIYDSLNAKSGLFGNSWSCPQLESGMFIKDKDAEWLTPWNEHVLLHENGNGIYLSNSGWEMDVTGEECAVNKDKWRFEYRNSRLMSIVSPSGINLSFEYDQHLSRVIRDSKVLIELKYGGDGSVTEILAEDGSYFLDYKKMPYLSAPKRHDSLQLVSEKTLLVEISGGQNSPCKFSYDAKGNLSEISKGESDKPDQPPLKKEPLKEKKTCPCPWCIPFL